MPTMMIGLLSIVIIVVSSRINKKMPGALIAMVITAVLVYMFDLEAAGVSVLGEIPRSLPPFADLPIFNWQLIRELSAGALAISALGLVEAMSIARSISAQSGERLDANQEFVGQGIANIAAGFFSGYTCSGSFTRSAVNYNSDARSPFAVIFSAILMAVAALLLSPMAAYLPRAALAGVLMVTAYQMVDRKEMKRIWHTSKGDSAIMIATLFATLALPLEFAVLTGVLVSFARYIAKTSMPEVHSMLPDEKFEHFEHQPEKPECPQLGVLTIEGSLYFGATSHVDDLIRAHMEAFPEQIFLLLRMHRVNHCDISGLHMLEAIVRLYRQKQGDVYMVGVRKLVWEKMRLSGFDQTLGIDHFLSQERAISHLFKILDPGICIYKCQIRAWKECQSLPKSYCEGKMPTGLLVPASVNIPNISSTNLWQRLNYENGTCPIVIDVREPYEFEKGHVPQAQLVPMPQLLATEVALPHEEEIILVCRTGRRSTQVVYALQQRGYNNLSNLTGGMVAWENAGLPAVID
jgi:SulP family sulfate permease